MYPAVETDQVEFKEITRGTLPKDLWETISGFSNLDGGTIYLGINKEGEVKGIPQKFHDKIQTDVIALCKGSFNEVVLPDLHITPEHVITIYIPPAPSHKRPIYSESRGLPKGGRIRNGSSNLQLEREHIERFAVAAQGGAELRIIEKNIWDVLDTQKVDDYIQRVNSKRFNAYRDFTREEVLEKMQGIKQGNPTMLGLLAFSHNDALQEITAPTYNIAVTHYRGTTKVSENIREVSLDDREFDGSVVEQFNGALKFIISKLPIHSEISTELTRKEYLAIPEVALRETLANAITHRDYTNRTARIQIDIYSDRVEFANPGRSLVPIEQIETSTPQSRNPLLIRFLRDYNITENRGRGIRTILNATRESGLPEPTFENIGEIFKTTLFTSAFVQEDDHTWLAQFKSYDLKESQLMCLLELKHNPSAGISNAEYCQLNNMDKKGDDRRARYEVNDMVAQGLIIKVGDKRYARYYLKPQYLEN